MSAYDAVVARAVVVVKVVQATVRILAAAGAAGAAALVVAIGLAGSWSSDALLFAAVIGAPATVAPVVLARFGAALGPVRALPEVSAIELRVAAGTLGANLKEGQRRFVEARGLRRVAGLGRALWDLRSDVQTLSDGGLAPATALLETLVPTRLLRVGLSAAAAPFLLLVGLLGLLIALIVT